MPEKTVPKPIARKILTLLEHGTAVTGLRLAYHDSTRRSGLPPLWMLHTVPFCSRIKKDHNRECALYCGGNLHRVANGLPQGRIDTCPFGCTQIFFPVFCEGVYSGVLFAGVVWAGQGESFAVDLPAVPEERWLEERRTVVGAIACKLGELLRGEAEYRPSDRRTTILRILQERRDSSLTLEELARELGLSASRAGHVVKELLGCTFPEALRRQRLQEAAHLLSTSDLPVGEVARLVGFDDPNYFSRLFTRVYELAPREYRRKYPVGA